MEIIFKVCVRCFTFNHVPYIIDTLNGFCIQKTTFPYVCTIIDDSSTDGEQDIINKYLIDNFDLTNESVARIEETDDYILTFAQHKINRNCYFAVYYLKYNHKSIKKTKKPYIVEWRENATYIALCEGDDYWICSNKLEKQVTFLESHPDYSMCFHNAVFSYEDISKPAKIFNEIGEDCEISIESIVEKWMIPTASIIYRVSVLPLFPVNGPIISGDWRLSLHCVVCGKIWAMKQVMSVYRKTYHTSSVASRYLEDQHLMIFQKVTILKGLDTYSNGKYHDLLHKYIMYYSNEARYIQLVKEKGKLIAFFQMPLFVMRQKVRCIVRRLNILVK